MEFILCQEEASASLSENLFLTLFAVLEKLLGLEMLVSTFLVVLRGTWVL